VLELDVGLSSSSSLISDTAILFSIKGASLAFRLGLFRRIFPGKLHDLFEST
jgi:hypothetical protein